MNPNLLNFENSLCTKLIAKTDIQNNIVVKCGEIYLNENKFVLICLYCDQNNQSLKEFQQHIFEKHSSEQNDIINNNDNISAVANEIIKNSDQEKYEKLNKKSDSKIIPILAKRKSPNIFQMNWRKFCQKKKELTNKLCEQANLEDKLKISSEHGQCFKSNILPTINANIKQIAKESYKNSQPFENDLLKHLHIFESDKKMEKVTNNNEEISLSKREVRMEKSIFLNNLKEFNNLEQEFLDNDEISSHNTKRHDSFFHCPKCPKSYRRFETLKNHFRHHTGEKNPFDCPVCQKSFSAKCRLEAHYRIHSNERPFPCHICNRAFRQKQKLKHHLKSHEKGTIKEMSNPYHNPASLPILINNKTIGAENTKTINGLYQCPLCYKCYKRFDSLKEHAEIHIEGLEHNCPICQKTLKTFRSLKKHVMLLHQNDFCSTNEIFNFNTSEINELDEQKEYISNDSTFLQEQNCVNKNLITEANVHQIQDENVIVKEFNCKYCKIIFKGYDIYTNHCKEHKFKYTC